MPAVLAPVPARAASTRPLPPRSSPPPSSPPRTDQTRRFDRPQQKQQQQNHRQRNGPPAKPAGQKPEHEILFQQFFKSVGPRTYASQVKRASNGNHYVIVTEGQRDEKSGDVRKTKLFVFSEDFETFFNLLRDTVAFVKANPVPPEVREKRARYWAKQAGGGQKRIEPRRVNRGRTERTH